MILENITRAQRLMLILLHLGLGVLLFFVPSLMTFWFWGIFLYGIFNLIINRNKNDVVGYLMGYLVGMEILPRMLQASVPWEMVKYCCVFLPLIALALESKKNERPSFIILYALMLVPSLMLIDFESFDRGRQAISFNLSGPLSIVFCTLYFYKRQFSTDQIRNLIFLVVLPALTTCMVIALRVPSIDQIKFQDAANFELSGGYGPNQVSSLLGFTVVLMLLAYYLKLVVSTSRGLDLLIAVVLFFFCIINFSRGGAITCIISVVLGMIVWIVLSKSERKTGFIFAFVTILVILTATFIYFDNLTGNALSKRYSGSLQEKGEVNENFGSGMSGREDILEYDYEIFLGNPILGVGPGMSQVKRIELFDNIKEAHTEFSRLLAEHGILGVVALLVLFIFPTLVFIKTRFFYVKVFTIMLASYSLISSFHTAMRLGMQGFAFGLCFIKLVQKRDDTADPERDYREKSMIWQQYERGLR